MENSLLIILSMADSKQTHADKLRFMLLMFDDHIRMSIPELNDEDYFSPVTELEYGENKEGPGDDDPPSIFFFSRWTALAFGL